MAQVTPESILNRVANVTVQPSEVKCKEREKGERGEMENKQFQRGTRL